MRGEKNANSMLQPALEMEVTVIQTLVFRRLESCDVLGSCVCVSWLWSVWEHSSPQKGIIKSQKYRSIEVLESSLWPVIAKAAGFRR